MIYDFMRMGDEELLFEFKFTSFNCYVRNVLYNRINGNVTNTSFKMFKIPGVGKLANFG